MSIVGRHPRVQFLGGRRNESWDLYRATIPRAITVVASPPRCRGLQLSPGFFILVVASVVSSLPTNDAVLFGAGVSVIVNEPNLEHAMRGIGCFAAPYVGCFFRQMLGFLRHRSRRDACKRPMTSNRPLSTCFFHPTECIPIHWAGDCRLLRAY